MDGTVHTPERSDNRTYSLDRTREKNRNSYAEARTQVHCVPKARRQIQGFVPCAKFTSELVYSSDIPALSLAEYVYQLNAPTLLMPELVHPVGIPTLIMTELVYCINTPTLKKNLAQGTNPCMWRRAFGTQVGKKTVHHADGVG